MRSVSVQNVSSPNVSRRKISLPIAASAGSTGGGCVPSLLHPSDRNANAGKLLRTVESFMSSPPTARVGRRRKVTRSGSDVQTGQHRRDDAITTFVAEGERVLHLIADPVLDRAAQGGPRAVQAGLDDLGLDIQDRGRLVGRHPLDLTHDEDRP